MTIYIPSPLRPFAAGKDAVEVAAATVASALEELTNAHPNLRKHLFTSEGNLRAFVNLYLNDDDVRYLPQKEATAVSPADTLSIIPSIAGGCQLILNPHADVMHPSLRLRRGPKIWLDCLVSRKDLVGFLVADGASDDHVIALFPVCRRRQAMLGS
jgi:adenylyltransferase/sulfurtransferase